MNITLIDGRQADVAGIHFDDSTYHFVYAGEDITNNMFQRDKIANFEEQGFDRSIDNERASAEHFAATHPGQTQPPTGSTSTWEIFFHQITTEPLKAPLEAVDAAVAQITASSGIKVIGFAVAALVVVVLIVKFK